MISSSLIDAVPQWFLAATSVFDYYPHPSGMGTGVGVTPGENPSSETHLTTLRSAIIDQILIYVDAAGTGTATVELLGYGGTGASYITYSVPTTPDGVRVIKVGKLFPGGFKVRTTGLEFNTTGFAVVNYHRVGAGPIV